MLELQRTAGNAAVLALLRHSQGRRLLRVPTRAPPTTAPPPIGFGFEVPVDRLLDRSELLVRFIRAYRGLDSDEDAERVRVEENWHWTGTPPVVTEAHVRAGFIMVSVSDLSQADGGLATLPPWLRQELSTLTAAEWEEYRSRTTVSTGDPARFAASIERFIAEVRERRRLAEARKGLAQRLVGLEDLYRRYRRYRQLQAVEHLRPPMQEADADRLDVAAIGRELEAAIQAHDFEGLADFERTINDYAVTFRAEVVALARELLDRYDHALAKQAERYSEQATSQALYAALAETPARLHFETAAQLGQSPPETPLTFDEIGATDAAIVRRQAQLSLGERAVGQLAGEHPLLSNWDLDRAALATASERGVQRLMLRYIKDRRHDIAVTRRNLATNPDLVFRLGPLLETAYANQHVEPGSVLDSIIKDWAAQAAWDDRLTDVMIGTLAIAVGFLTAGGGAVLMLGGMAMTAGLGGWQTLRELHRYEVMEAAAGAQLASPEDRVSFAWVVVALGATGLDALGIGLALYGLRPAVQAFNASGDLLAFDRAVADVPLTVQARAAVMDAARLRAQETAAWRALKPTGVYAYDVLGVIAREFGLFAYAVYASIRSEIRQFDAFLETAEAVRVLGKTELTPEVLSAVRRAFDDGLEQCDRIIAHGKALRFGDGQVKGFMNLWAARPTLTADQVIEEMDALRQLRPVGEATEGLPLSLTNTGLASPLEQGMIDDYVDGLRELRAALEEYWRASKAVRNRAWRMQYPEKMLAKARARLELIEDRAVQRGTAQLIDDLDPLVTWRGKLEAAAEQQTGDEFVLETLIPGRGGISELKPTSVGLALKCNALDEVRAAGLRLRDSSFEEIRAAMEAQGRTPALEILPTRSHPGQPVTGAGRVEWKFEDGSKLVVDWPQELPGRPASANVPHAELHGPQGERLNEQGIVVPAASNPAHMPITVGRVSE